MSISGRRRNESAVYDELTERQAFSLAFVMKTLRPVKAKD